MSGAVLSAMALEAIPLVVTLSGGPSQFSITPSSGHDFGNNAASVSGGSGSYAYLWSLDDSDGAWALSSTTASTTDVSVSEVVLDTATANVICAVTDMASGRKGSAQTAYRYIQYNPN
jgi:hypothetical protein